jgi:hypothetical protein
VRDQVSHPYKTTGKIIVLHILIYVFLESKPEDQMAAGISRVQSALNFFMNLIFDFFRVVPKYSETL